MKLFTDIAIVLATVIAGCISTAHGAPLYIVLPIVAIVAAIGVSMDGEDERRPRG